MVLQHQPVFAETATVDVNNRFSFPHIPFIPIERSTYSPVGAGMALILQRQIREGRRWVNCGWRGVSDGTVWLARCAAGRRPAIAAVRGAPTAAGAASHAPLSTPAAW